MEDQCCLPNSRCPQCNDLIKPLRPAFVAVCLMAIFKSSSLSANCHITWSRPFTVSVCSGESQSSRFSQTLKMSQTGGWEEPRGPQEKLLSKLWFPSRLAVLSLPSKGCSLCVCVCVCVQFKPVIIDVCKHARVCRCFTKTPSNNDCRHSGGPAVRQRNKTCRIKNI